MTKRVVLAAAAAALTMLATASHAVVITSASNNPYNFSWSYFTGSYNLTGNGVITASGFNSNQLDLGITLTNTSPNAGQGGDRLTAFAFGINPNFTGVQFLDASDGGLTSAGPVTNGALPANVPGVEACVFGGMNCSGGGNGGIYANTSDSFTVRLLGTWGSSVDISPLGLRYQTGNGSFTFGVTEPPTEVPEPATVAMLGMGLLGLGLIRRRKQAA